MTTITIRADFEDGRFEVTDAPYITRRKDELEMIEKIVKAQPGITQNGIAKHCGIRTRRQRRAMCSAAASGWSLCGGGREQGQ